VIMTIHKKYFGIASLSIAISVALGAFGAHGLKDSLKSEYLITFDTGVKYQLYHSFAIFMLAFLMLHYKDLELKLIRSFYLFIIGIILFSGSLYLLTYFRLQGNENMNWLGAIAPIGGLSFIAAWLNIAVYMFKPVKN